MTNQGLSEESLIALRSDVDKQVTKLEQEGQDRVREVSVQLKTSTTRLIKAEEDLRVAIQKGDNTSTQYIVRLRQEATAARQQLYDRLETSQRMRSEASSAALRSSVLALKSSIDKSTQEARDDLLERATEILRDTSVSIEESAASVLASTSSDIQELSDNTTESITTLSEETTEAIEELTDSTTKSIMELTKETEDSLSDLALSTEQEFKDLVDSTSKDLSETKEQLEAKINDLTLIAEESLSTADTSYQTIQSLAGMGVFFMTECPDGWIPFNGTVVDISVYPTWFNQMRTDTAVDLTDRFLQMTDSQRVLGDLEGYATAMPSNYFTTNYSGAHSHSYYSPSVFNRGITYYAAVSNGGSDASYVSTQYSQTSAVGNHNHSVNGGDAETRPKNVAVMFCSFGGIPSQ